MDYAHPGALVSTAWLAEHVQDPRIRVVDGSFHLPTSGRNARAKYLYRHIPSAVFFDIDRIADEASGLPHMLPRPEAFAAAMEGLGIGSDDLVIIYDQVGSAAARVWWTFGAFGHRNVTVLDGGLEKWLAEGRAVDNQLPLPRQVRFVPRFNPNLVRSVEQMLANVESRREQVVDNRGPGRFRGIEPEPRPARKQGHIPGAINIPFNAFISPEQHGVWRPADEITALFEDAGVDLKRPIVASCGSGITACTTAFAARLIGRDDVAVYDGSWAEWGNRDDTPVER